ncbi:MAG: hypothetical protein LAO51_12280 [Acidobacteriia bacterium]|nr:hypothetical protein [Terriglobia bacterium]
MKSRVFESPARVVFALVLALSGTTVLGLTPRAVAAPTIFPPERPRLEPPGKHASFSFDLVTSAGAAVCLPDAQGEVRITSRGANQVMDVFVTGLPANTTFTVFVLQLPHSPFGLSRYEGDVETNRRGEGHASFVGIFSDETFIVAPGPGAAPVLHPGDANVNPATAPVHTLHLGMWFDSTADAAAAGCAANRTPFNGDHTAGIQVLNTTNFPDEDGPIGRFGR